ncbi:hypothetical protein ACS0X5_24875 [Burkholderia gladioli]|uniref:Uncharacterized protein n=1 Tax=Burkholderia gladioli (strain BSR3) TaxID=999541 RepID=F2LRL2_BURGS|nr:hypothetical protein [Burkholderia gladioli]AEA65506.1 hypothetical protein bgla_1p1090 [Burkholderia gladioli BSR3]MBW5288061.1 hypothetical protein [Burkholderia gladioli]
MASDRLPNAAYLDAAKTIYRAAIDPRASDAESEAWWSAVADELAEVIAAPTASEAAAVIGWWHREWASVNDTPRAAAGRIRRVARAHGGVCRRLLAGARLASSSGDTHVDDR